MFNYKKKNIFFYFYIYFLEKLSQNFEFFLLILNFFFMFLKHILNKKSQNFEFLLLILKFFLVYIFFIKKYFSLRFLNILL
jgi:hypothetical protein